MCPIVTGHYSREIWDEYDRIRYTPYVPLSPCTSMHYPLCIFPCVSDAILIYPE